MGAGGFVNILFEKSLVLYGISPAFPGFPRLRCYENGHAGKVAK
jgi:hypothetical protein